MAHVLGCVRIFQLFGDFGPPSRLVLSPVLFRVQDRISFVAPAAAIPSKCFGLNPGTII